MGSLLKTNLGPNLDLNASNFNSSISVDKQKRCKELDLDAISFKLRNNTEI